MTKEESLKDNNGEQKESSSLILSFDVDHCKTFQFFISNPKLTIKRPLPCNRDH